MTLITSIDQYPTLLRGLQALSESERRAHLRNLFRTDLYFLLRYGCNRPDLERKWLFERCREVQASPNGHLDLWAREHYKSTIITFGKGIQDILSSHGEDPFSQWNGRETTMGIFSHTRPAAKKFLRQIKTELETNALLKLTFPDILYQEPQKQSPKWSEDEGIVVKRKSNPGESTVEAWGLIDGQPTGKHFIILNYDDVVTEASVTSPDMMENTTDKLALSYNLGSAGGVRRFIGTRYHFSDTYGTVLKRGTATPRIYPATDDGTETGVPVLLTAETLAEKRRDYGPYIFGCQMLQNPKADALQGFRREWLRYYHGTNYGQGMNKYILVDPANEKKKTSDYTVMMVIGLGEDGNYYWLDGVRDRLNLTERCSRLFQLHKKHKPLQVRYEKYGKDADITHIESEQERVNYRFEIIEVGGSTPKNDRIKRLVPLFEQGKVYIPETLHITDYEKIPRDLVQSFIEEEYVAFPVPIHDDMLDCMARIAEPGPEYALIWPTQQEEDEPRGYGRRKKTYGESAWAA